MWRRSSTGRYFFFSPAPSSSIYTLSLHDALPISGTADLNAGEDAGGGDAVRVHGHAARSEEHTSELQSQSNLVCRLLLEKKKQKGTVLRVWQHFLDALVVRFGDGRRLGETALPAR